MDLLIYVGIMIAVVVILGYGLPAICNAVVEHKELEKRKKHPQFYSWIDELENIGNQIAIFHKKNVGPFEKLIDDIVKNWKYYPAELREVKKDELELFRLRLYQYREVEKSMQEQAKELREKIKAYNAEHNVEKYWDE